MSFVFSNMTHFNANIGSWNTSAVKTMKGLFSGAESFNKFPELFINSVLHAVCISVPCKLIMQQQDASL